MGPMHCGEGPLMVHLPPVSVVVSWAIFDANGPHSCLCSPSASNFEAVGSRIGMPHIT